MKERVINDPSSIGWVEDGVTTDGDPIWRWESSSSGGGIPEAPLDSRQYGRQNASWTVVSSTGEGGDDSRITDTQISNWDTSYTWGNHSDAGYLTEFTEEDPTVPLHVKDITTQDIANWNASGGTGDVSSVNGYTGVVNLTASDVGAIETEEDPTVPAYVKGITEQDIANWNASGGTSDVSSVNGYTGVVNLTASDVGAVETEEDPTVPDHVKSITTTDIDNWNNGSSGGSSAWDDITGKPAEFPPAPHNHDLVYQPIGTYVTEELDPTVPDHVKSITTVNISDWNSSYGWGDHSTAGYAKVNDIPSLVDYPVTSVNGKTGAVSLSAGDVGAAASSHSHDYAASNHNHSGVYATASHSHDYAASNHTHSGYAASNHSHDYSNTYAAKSHTHNYAAASHTHPASQITTGTFASGTYRFPGALTAAGDITAYYSSDERLKNNFEKLNGLDLVSKLNGYRFHWDDDKCEELEMEQRGIDVGVIAQEVMGVLPEVCTVRDNGYLGVKYEKLVPVLIQAIKELQDQIDELKGEG